MKHLSHFRSILLLPKRVSFFRDFGISDLCPLEWAAFRPSSSTSMVPRVAARVLDYVRVWIRSRRLVAMPVQAQERTQEGPNGIERKCREVHFRSNRGLRGKLTRC